MNFLTGNNCPVSLPNLAKAFKCKYVQIGAGLVAVGFVGLKLKSWAASRALQADRATFRKDVVYLYTFPRCDAYGLISPAGGKVEIFLRLAKIPYVVISTMDTGVSPTGRLPCITYNGETIADSQVIVDTLTEKLNVSLDKTLSVEQRSQGTLMATALEKSAWIHSERLAMVENGHVILPVVLKEFGFGSFTSKRMAAMFRKQIIKFLNNHGNGDVPTEQCDKELTDMLKAVEVAIKKNGFAIAEKPTSADAVVYGTLMLMAGHVSIAGPGAAKSFAFMGNSEVLNNYVKTMEGIVYPDKAGLKMSAGRQTFA